MKKKQLTSEQIYKRNQKWAKGLKIAAPIVFWGCLGLSIFFILTAIKNSFGNVVEIIKLLDSKKFTGEQLQANYAYLLDKYGNWVIGSGSKGFMIEFINIGHAIFSGIMISCTIAAGVLFLSSLIFGKWILPAVSRQIIQDNQDMVNLTILKDKDKR